MSATSDPAENLVSSSVSNPPLRVNGFRTVYSRTENDKLQINRKWFREDGRYCYIGGHKWYYYLKVESSNDSKELSVDMQGPVHDKIRIQQSQPRPNIRRELQRRTPALLGEQQWSNVVRGLVIHLTIDNKRLFALFPNYIEFLKYETQFPAEFRGFYETVFGQSYQKPHFDLDINLEEDQAILDNVTGKTSDQIIAELLHHTIKAIVEVLNEFQITIQLESDLLLFSSHGSKKRSYHIVIDNYYHINNKEAGAFYQLVISKIPSFYRRWIDCKVYSTVQQFRLEGSQKIGSGRIKTLCLKWSYGDRTIIYRFPEKPLNDFHRRVLILGASLLSNTGKGRCLPSFIEHLPQVAQSSVNRSVLSDFNHLSYEEGIAALELVARKAGVTSSDHRFPYQFVQIMGGLVILKRVKRSHCRLCDRIHDNENPFLIVAGTNRDVYFDCRRNEENRRLYVGSLGNEIRNDPSVKPELTDEQLLAMPVVVPRVNDQGEIVTEASPPTTMMIPSSSIVPPSSTIPTIVPTSVITVPTSATTIPTIIPASATTVPTSVITVPTSVITIPAPSATLPTLATTILSPSATLPTSATTTLVLIPATLVASATVGSGKPLVTRDYSQAGTVNPQAFIRSVTTTSSTISSGPTAPMTDLRRLVRGPGYRTKSGRHRGGGKIRRHNDYRAPTHLVNSRDLWG